MTAVLDWRVETTFDDELLHLLVLGLGLQRLIQVQLFLTDEHCLIDHNDCNLLSYKTKYVYSLHYILVEYDG